MQDPNKKQDKIEAHEIHIGGVKRAREERPKGKFGRWFENFWYHHKWKTIIAFSFTVIALICTLQMCSKEKQDTSVLMVGPYQLSDSEAGYVALKHTLSSYLPEDAKSAGNVGIVHYAVYSKEQIEALAQHVDEDGNPAPIARHNGPHPLPGRRSAAWKPHYQSRRNPTVPARYKPPCKDQPADCGILPASGQRSKCC